jgi:hypothetical protein
VSAGVDVWFFALKTGVLTLKKICQSLGCSKSSGHAKTFQALI